MSVTRRDAIKISGSTLAGLSLSGVTPADLVPQAAPAAQAQEFPATLTETNVRDWAELPLNADGSAPAHPESAAGPIRGRLMWRADQAAGRAQGVTPPGEYDYTKMRIRVDPRGNARLRGTMVFADLEKLPRHSQTTLLQCGTPEPTGIVKWTGVRFSEFAKMIGLSSEAHYARFIATDRHYVDEPVATLMHPQVMLAWMMNDQPLSADHGAPLRLIIPFRYGNRSIKAITDIMFGTPSLPALQLPG
jgi:DMSO/TMAO reductase YedYZ molybdopterin-dependent catalytic subunit